MENFKAISAELASAGATSRVDDAKGLASEVELLLTDSELRERRAASAQSVVRAKSEILDTVFQALDPYLQGSPSIATQPACHARA